MNHLTDSQFNEYLDHLLDAAEQAKIEAHLQACAECRAQFEELRQVTSTLADLREIKLIHDLTPPVMTRLAAKKSLLSNPFWAAQAGAALGVLLWLATQAVTFLHLPLFQFPQFAIPPLQFVVPQLTIPDLPAYRLPNLPTFEISTFNLVLISIGISLLWLIGNLSLLRNHSGVQK